MDSQQEKLMLEKNAELEKELAEKNRALEIEAALEKVRSRSLAMHKSDELKEVIVVVFEKLKELGLVFEDVGIQLFKQGSADFVMWVAAPDHLSQPVLINLPNAKEQVSKNQISGEFWAAKERHEPIYNRIYSREEKNKYFDYVDRSNPGIIPQQVRDYQREAPSYTVTLVPEKNSALMVDSWKEQLASFEGFDVLQRFAKVFEQAYTRFLDLQRAETQAKEAEIQLALERVRARTMAMQKSEELADVAGLLFKQVSELGIKAWTTGFNVWSDDNNSFTDYITSPRGGFIEPYKVDAPLPTLRDVRKRGEEFFVFYLEGEILKETYRQLSKFGDKQQYEKMVEDGFQFPERQFNHFVFGSKVSLMFITYEPVPEAHVIFKRFGKVFEQTYTRFLDLQKAEAQAREAQIQLALERVRARTMAMQKSDELQVAANLLFQQVQALGLPVWSCGYNIWEKNEKVCTGWMSSEGLIQPPFRIPLTETPTFIRFYESRQKDESFYVEEVGGEALKAHYDYMLTLPDFAKIAERHIRAGFPLPEFQINHVANFTRGNLIFITNEPVPEAWEIFKRFAGVFDQTYTRFLDLQKAEAQAREAMIEAALERVRSRSMAMHKSDEVMDVAVTVYDELQKLDFKFGAATIIIMNEQTGNMEHWLAGFIQKNHIESYQVNNSEHPLHAAQLAAWREGAKFVSIEMSGTALKSYAEEMFTQSGYRNLPDEEKAMLSEQEHAVFNLAYMNHGALMWAPSPLSHEKGAILQRFAKVFEQTYTRFLDLQKAEAQAREAQIELGLERVRARAMAMQKSDELAELVDGVFKELTKLHFILDRCIITIIDEDSVSAKYWMANPEVDKTPVAYQVPLNENSYLKATFGAWKERKIKWMYDLKGEEKSETARYLFSKTELSFLPEEVKKGMADTKGIFLSSSFNNFGSLQADTIEPLSEDNFEILYRFGKVFDLTYTRFNDLKQAEAQAREAQIQLALERIRSRSLAMHHSNELKDVVVILFQQLKRLGLEFDGGAAIHLFSENSKDAIILVASSELLLPIQNNLPYDEEAFLNNSIILDVWDAKETGKNIFNRFYSFEEKNKYFNYVFKHNGLEILPQPLRNFILQADSYTASFIAEKNSLLGANSWTRQVFSENDFEILKRIAKVFEQAYIRFLDLTKAEALAVRAEQDLIEIKAARKKAEDTLIELKSTQAQLIQKEKMASLGELTAGVAHEIQNPLNFVNNFSEVNKEMLAEMKEEIDKGNYGEAKMIANAIEENQEKINQHGKRADDIVKGMLQHSRTASGQKEPTNINALCDEYLRLSYHGLRAKDKGFNADFTTAFDEHLDKINIVPQDIGRVLLNLYNNAFYAVNEQKKAPNLKGENYEPTVTVTTKRISSPSGAGGLEVSVKDNGIGIPQNIIDKVFQPFFTTKPTGQGTGLGLSLSYDIIKAHGGEIKVESKEGEGSEFVIRIPT